MKCFLPVIAAASAALFMAGCQTDYGVYYGRSSNWEYSGKPGKLKRSFDLPEPKDAIAPLGRDALVGTWRILVEDTERTVYPPKAFGKDCLTGSVWSKWKLEEWNFAPDGRYTTRRCAKSSGKPIAGTEEGGTWTYDGGVLAIDAEYKNLPAPFFGANKYDWTGKKRLAFDLAWHSAHEFTAKCRDADAYAKSVCGATGKGAYDEDGCFRAECSFSGEGWAWETEQVISPLRFRRMDAIMR